ncbi:MAG: tyrosine-type recombinase/integrase [Bacteroidales bacterium]|nr:tyrosine-type recombinase/integrase [Bacteroidales bacterium]
MKTITLSRRTHEGNNYILLYCDYDPLFIKKARSFSSLRWGRSLAAWYIPEKEGLVKSIIAHFKDGFEIDATGLHRQKSTAESIHSGVDNYPAGGLGPVKMTIDQAGGRIVIRFMGRYDQKWISELKQYGRPYYDPVKKEWHLLASRVTMDSLTDYFNREGINLIIKKAVKQEPAKKVRDSAIEKIRNKELPVKTKNSINELKQFFEEQRYSKHTLDSYVSHLELFFKYNINKNPDEITNEDISGFMDNVVIRHGYSASFQNQLLSAIKAYYCFHGKGKLNLEEIKRPRKSKPLPSVLSKEEVTKILKSTRNVKHSLLLYIIYSCGLRRGEVINIRLRDLNRERKTLHIKSGKGNIDRMVPVSDKVWRKLDEYLSAYKPSDYLFEGQKEGKYSAGSVYKVFCQAAKRAGIDRDIGVHCLRHSYATHLHEGGLDIRYIQELLGHKSSKTTEIYTHVSRRNLLNIKNPLDDLDIH